MMETVETGTAVKTAPVDVHLVDRLLFSGSLNELSTAVIEVIHNTLEAQQPVYQPDTVAAIAESIAAAGSEENVVAHIDRVLTAFGALHEAVRHRLENPQSDVERDIVENHAREVSPWTQPFKRPPVHIVVRKLFPDGHIPKAIQDQLSLLEDAGRQEHGAEKASPYLAVLKRRKPGEVLSEMEKDFVGLEELRREAQKLAFTQAFEAALARTGAGADGEEKIYGEVIAGNEGLGKSRFAHKKAELLVALGLAGPKLVEFTERNSAAPSMNMPPQALAALFAQADIISIEVPDSPNDGRPDSADFGRRLVAALQASFEGREDKPVIFITGKPDTLNDVVTHNPGLKPYIGAYFKAEDLTLDQLGEVLDRKLGKGMAIEDDARAAVLKAFDEGRKKLGKEFPNAIEAADMAKNLKTALAARLFGPNAVAGADYDTATLTTVTLADVNALNIKRIIAGPAIARPERIGF